MNACDLHVHSGYSTYDGLGSPESVVERAVALGWGAVALTEHGHAMSAPALYRAARKAKIKPIIGIELYVTPEESLVDGDKTVLQNRRHLTVLALSLEGYQNIVAWINASMDRPAYYNGPRISLDRMAEVAPNPLDHNVILSGCLGGELCQCLLHQNGNADLAARMYLEQARMLFPNFYVELMNHGLPKFMDEDLHLDNYATMVYNQETTRIKLLDLAQELAIPVIVTNDSHYQTQPQRKPHLAMMARKSDRSNRQTSESFHNHYQYWTNYMRPMETVADTLPSWAAKQAIESIEEIVEAADVRLDPLDKFAYTFPRSAHDDPIAEIDRRCKSRLKRLVARHGQVALDRYRYELQAMEEFAHYLLIYSDIVRMARSQGIYTWTRGSAANSLVCYCLKIHEIDPIHYNLLFERFVNPERAKFPDVDIDIEAHRQGDVVKMVSEYMAENEGVGNMLPICTFSTLSNRNAFRIMAEAAGVEKDKIDDLAKLLPQMIDSGMVESDEEAYTILADELGIDIYKNAAAIFDQVGSISQHACAFALGTESRPLSSWVPIYRIGSSDAVVTEFNMKWIEEMGFQKLDLLRLDTLTIMHSIARMLGKGIDWLDEIGQSAPGIYDIEDDDLYAMLRAGRTEGVHSMQGGTQRRGCIEIGVESDRDLIAVQALYRPSGTRSHMDVQFVNRKHGREDWQSLNKYTKKRWAETYDLPIFQEQIMEMGFDLGMSGAEVDDLYRAIKTAKGVGRGAAELFEAFEPTFRKHADKLMPKGEADEIWQRWDAMQGYTFNRGHATSYAILALKTAWLRVHYPREFFIALLERYPDNPRYVSAAMGEGFTFDLPDVNTSNVGFSRGRNDHSIQVGLVRIAGIGIGAAAAIVRNQPFASVEDMVERVGSRFIKQGEKVNTLDILANVGAMQSFGIKSDPDDFAQFKLLNFVLGTPKAFKGCKPQLGARRGGSWKFEGLTKSVQITEGKTFCAKLFWIPLEPEFAIKTSASGKYNASLLTVVDVNGLPFDLIVSEAKVAESKLVKYLWKKCAGGVICAEGQVAMPFLRGGNTGFRLWGITGAEDGNPQAWHIDEDDAKAMVHLAVEKRSERTRA